MRHLRRVQVGAGKVGPLKIAKVQIGALQVGLAEVRVGRLEQVRFLEVGRRQVGPINLVEAGAAEIGLHQTAILDKWNAGAGERGPVEPVVGQAVEVGVAQLGAPQVAVVEPHGVQLGAFQMCVAEVDVAQHEDLGPVARVSPQPLVPRLDAEFAAPQDRHRQGFVRLEQPQEIAFIQNLDRGAVLHELGGFFLRDVGTLLYAVADHQIVRLRRDLVGHFALLLFDLFRGEVFLELLRPADKHERLIGKPRRRPNVAGRLAGGQLLSGRRLLGGLLLGGLGFGARRLGRILHTAGFLPRRCLLLGHDNAPPHG